MATKPKAKRKPARKAAKPKRKAAKVAKKKSAAGSIVIPPSTGGSAAWTRASGEVGIRVRMYRVGFGDFFLLTFLGEAGDPIHVIVDCGVFKGTKQTGDIGTYQYIFILSPSNPTDVISLSYELDAPQFITDYQVMLNSLRF